MSAFVKTLLGDARNISVVAAILAIAAVLVLAGQASVTAFVIPPLTLAGVAWLARH